MKSSSLTETLYALLFIVLAKGPFRQPGHVLGSSLKNPVGSKPAECKVANIYSNVSIFLLLKIKICKD